MRTPLRLTGVIIDRHPYKSSSIIAEAVTDRGTMSVLCRSAKKDGAGAELSRVALLSLVVVPGREDLYTLSSASITRDHPSIHGSALKLSAVSYFFSLVKAVKSTDEERMLPLVDAALSAFEAAADETDATDALLLSSTVKLLYISGVLPKLDGCVVCDSPYADGFYSIVRGGYVCARCADPVERKVAFPPAVQRAFSGLIRSPIADAVTFTDVPPALTLIVRRTIAAYAGVASKSAKAYDEIAAVYAVSARKH
ncbi:MAG: DNA repair protein RecO [Spirochaetota bacterium]